MKDTKETKDRAVLYNQYKEKIAALLHDKKKMTAACIGLLRGCISLLFSFILASGRFVFGCYPFGVAMLAGTRKNLVFFWLGAVLAILRRGGEGITAEILAISFLFAVKSYFSFVFPKEEHAGKGEPIFLSVTLAVLAGGIIGIGGCIVSGFTVYALLSLLTMLVASGIACFLFCGLTVPGGMSKIYKRAAIGSLLFALVYSLGNYSFYSFSPNLTVAVTCALFFAGRSDLLFSGVLGAVLGLACGYQSVLPLCLLALVASAAFKYSSKIAPWLGVLAGFSASFYLEGNSSFLYVLPDMVCGVLFYLPLRYYNDLYQKKATEQFTQKPSSALSPPADAMGNLSDKLFQMSEKLRTPTREEALGICRDSLGKICTDCGKGCFKEDARVRAIADSLFETGTLGAPQMGETQFSGCKKWRSICDDINNEYCAHAETLYRCDRALCYANSYKSLSKTLADAEKERREQDLPNEVMTERFEKALLSADIEFHAATARGKRETVFTIHGIDPTQIGGKIHSIKQIIEKGCAVSLGMPQIAMLNGKNCLIFKRSPSYTANLGVLSEKKPGEEVCGDATYSFVSDNYFYLLLCDGMGSGRNAALASGIACHFAKELFSMSASLATVLETVNDFLLCQSFECSTTFDLMRLDLFDGHCDFIKSGACPSLVIRADNTFRVASMSVPVGATKEVNSEKISLKLRPGDRIVFFTDGIANTPEEAPWLDDLLEGRLRRPVKETAEDILIRSERGKNPDDRSVAVVEIGFI